MLTWGLKFAPDILRNESRNVVDDHGIQGGSIVRSGECANGTLFNRKRSDGGDNVRLQLENFRRGLRANARNTNRSSRSVIVFEGFEFHGIHIRGGKHLVGGGIDFLEVGGANEALDEGDMGAMLGIQGKAFGENFEEKGDRRDVIYFLLNPP